MTRRCVICKKKKKNMSITFRSRSLSAVKLCEYTSVKHVRVQTITLSCMVGFQIISIKIIRTRQCVICKNYVASFKVTVILRMKTVSISYSENIFLYQVCTFVLNSGILFGINKNQYCTLCRGQEPCRKLKDQGHGLN